ncbi:MAG: ABC transporter ATP-binding protein [Victivallales bacterium]|nr:ABC transporter ATP-binding protein [Victivallales bacterium]
MAEENANVVVEAKGLTKVFRDFWGRPKANAVNGIDFQVHQGEVFGLLGPNGSGKSTTIKMILGLLYPTRGSLSVFGKDPQDVETKNRIGYLPEETYLYKYLTAFETLDFFGALFGQEVSVRKERARQLLEMVGLAHAFNRPVGEFSKGMARRIGLAQALVNDPDLVILDEPTSGLDPIGCREVKDVIRLLASRGKTIILCSHLLADVQDVCDNLVVLYGGQIRASGNLSEILKEEDRTRVVTPTLSEQTVKELREWLAAKGIKQDVSIDHPVMDLEDFFLDVVNKARNQNASTAGAHAGGQVPEYLENKSGKTILETLTYHEEPKKAEAPIEPEQPKVDEEKLKKLADAQPKAEDPIAPIIEKTEEEAAKLKAANDKLAGKFGPK